MARWTATAIPWTPAAVADTTQMATGAYFALKTTTAAQRLNIWEVKLGGLASAPAPMALVLARSSTLSGTITQGSGGGRLAANDPATATLAGPVSGTSAATTQPSRDTNLYLLDLGYNAYGGLCRLQQPPEGPIGMLGNTQPFAEVTISGLSPIGTAGLTSGHIVFETL